MLFIFNKIITVRYFYYLMNVNITKKTSFIILKFNYIYYRSVLIILFRKCLCHDRHQKYILLKFILCGEKIIFIICMEYIQYAFSMKNRGNKDLYFDWSVTNKHCNAKRSMCFAFFDT